jgi:hypothetical protein
MSSPYLCIRCRHSEFLNVNEVSGLPYRTKSTTQVSTFTMEYRLVCQDHYMTDIETQHKVADKCLKTFGNGCVRFTDLDRASLYISNSGYTWRLAFGLFMDRINVT